MQTYVFLDLDNTIFQTRGKCPPEEALSLIPAAFHRDGSPLSFMSPRQRQLFEWLSAAATVIPVTARNESAFHRVTLPFRHAVILDFGGVVLLPDGQLDEQWDDQIRPMVSLLGNELTRIQEALQATSDSLSLGVRVRVICDFDLQLYVVAKQVDGDVDALRQVMEQHAALAHDERFFVHFNDNNLSVVALSWKTAGCRTCPEPLCRWRAGVDAGFGRQPLRRRVSCNMRLRDDASQLAIAASPADV